MRPELVRPGQQLIEPSIEVRLLRVERPVDHLQDFARLRGDARQLHLAGQSVEGDEVAFLDRLALDPELLRRLVDLELARADDRRLAHLPADDRGVRGHPARRGENALRDEHPMDVVRHGLAADENHLLPLVRPTSTAWSAENTTCPLAAPGDAGSPLVDGRDLLPLVRIETWRQQLVERLGIDEQHRLFRRNQLLARRDRWRSRRRQTRCACRCASAA